jgi:hypothetical protein
MTEQTVEEMRAKVLLASMLIKELYQDTDPRAAKAIEALQEQQRAINKLLVEKTSEEHEGPAPPSVVVGLRSIELGARALR